MLTAAAALLGVAVAAPRTLDSAKAERKGEMTIGKVLDRGSEVARIVAADSGELKLVAQVTNVPDIDGSRYPVWDVGCFDKRQILRLRIQIDGRTGDLIHLTANGEYVNRHAQGRLTKQDAEFAASGWVSATDPLGPSTKWKLTNTWRIPGGWSVRFDGSGIRTFVTLSDRNGALESMSSSRRLLRVASANLR